MNDILDTMRSLESFSPWQPASKDEIMMAEKELGLTFADDYKEYLSAFGAMDAYGIELTGIIDDDMLNVVTATKSAWEFHTHVPHTFYLIEDAHVDGISIWQDSSGAVYESAPNNLLVEICASLTEYVTMTSAK